jgi:hypothetical protein
MIYRDTWGRLPLVCRRRQRPGIQQSPGRPGRDHLSVSTEMCTVLLQPESSLCRSYWCARVIGVIDERFNAICDAITKKCGDYIT